jgi:hypothetical protein
MVPGGGGQVGRGIAAAAKLFRSARAVVGPYPAAPHTYTPAATSDAAAGNAIRA